MGTYPRQFSLLLRAATGPLSTETRWGEATAIPWNTTQEQQNSSNSFYFELNLACLLDAMCPVLHVEGLRTLPGICMVGHQRAGSSLCVHLAFHLCFLYLYLVPSTWLWRVRTWYLLEFLKISLKIKLCFEFFFSWSRVKCLFLNLNCRWSAEISFAVPKMKVFVFRSMDAQKEVFPTELTLKYTVSKVRNQI